MAPVNLSLKDEQQVMSASPISTTIVLSALVLCVLLALLFVYVHFVWNSRRRASNTAHFWNSQRFEVNDADAGGGRLDRATTSTNSEQRLLLNTNCDDDSSGNSD